MKESTSLASSLYLILSLNDLFSSPLRELGISFHSLAPVHEKAFFVLKS